MVPETVPSMPAPLAFVDRRMSETETDLPVVERRQFANSHGELSSDARELATAIDDYKLRHRRRFVTFEEMLQVVRDLGYRKGQS